MRGAGIGGGLSAAVAETITANWTFSGQIRASDGSAAAPGYAFSGATNQGMYREGGAIIFSSGGSPMFSLNYNDTGEVSTVAAGRFAWSSTSSPTGSPDLTLYRDAADTRAQRRGTNAQESRLYSRYDDATNYHRACIKSAVGTASAVSGASVTLSGLIPDGALVLGVTTEIVTALGATNSTTGYTVGDGADADRWGVVAAITQGTVSSGTAVTSGTVSVFTAANDVVLTATGGDFDGTGAIRVHVHYIVVEAS
jgi:hypothetical protein